MAVMASVDTPFNQCDTDTATVTSTGGTLAATFTNLTRTTQREVLIRNRGLKNVSVGKSVAAARWPIEPGDVLRLSCHDLTKVALVTSGSDTTTVDIFQVY